MMKALEKGHNYKRWAEKAPNRDTCFCVYDPCSISLCRVLSGWGPNGSELWNPPSSQKPLTGTWKACTYSGWGQWPKAEFKSFFNPFLWSFPFSLSVTTRLQYEKPGRVHPRGKDTMHFEGPHVTTMSSLLERGGKLPLKPDIGISVNHTFCFKVSYA